LPGLSTDHVLIWVGIQETEGSSLSRFPSGNSLRFSKRQRRVSIPARANGPRLEPDSSEKVPNLFIAQGPTARAISVAISGSAVGIGRAFSPRICLRRICHTDSHYPGRCPGLIWERAVGPLHPQGQFLAIFQAPKARFYTSEGQRPSIGSRIPGNVPVLSMAHGPLHPQGQFLSIFQAPKARFYPSEGQRPSIGTRLPGKSFHPFHCPRANGPRHFGSDFWVGPSALAFA